MSQSNSRGIITIAIGDRFYSSLAADLARSLELHCPGIPRAIVTNNPDIPELKELYQDRIEPIKDRGYAFAHKLLINEYSPFEETIFIDADSLVFRDLDFIWELYANQDIGFQGKNSTKGEWYGMEMSELLQKTNLPHIVQVQTGLLYFNRTPEAEKFFEIAKEYYPTLPDLGFGIWKHRAEDAMSDEPAFGLAAAQLGIGPTDDPEKLMGFPMGLRGNLEIDVISGHCELTSGPGYYLEKEKRMKPSVFHFCTWHTHPVYTSERGKLRLHEKHPWARPFLKPIGTAIKCKEQVSKLLRGRQ